MKKNFQVEKVLEKLTGEEWETSALGEQKGLDDHKEVTLGMAKIVRIP